jgi:hypothetical protein
LGGRALSFPKYKYPIGDTELYTQNVLWLVARRQGFVAMECEKREEYNAAYTVATNLLSGKKGENLMHVHEYHM